MASFPIQTADAFLASLEQLELLPEDRLNAIRAESSAGDLKALTQALIAQDELTAFQVRTILEDKGKDLVLGDYRLLEPLGGGGMGHVFKALHTLMHRTVAIKILRPDLSSHPQVLARFLREIRLLSKLSHTNIVTAFDAAEVEGQYLLVMEYCPGEDLHQVVQREGLLPVQRACDYIRQAALGLQHIHEPGLVHRDIKPANLLLTQGTVKVLDLGLSRLLEANGSHTGMPNPTSKGEALTHPGAYVGTPDFSAPEQALNIQQADIRSDIYSLGCTFYFLLTGTAPFPNGTAMEKFLAHRDQIPPPVPTFRDDVPPEVVAILQKMMAKKPEDRYQEPIQVAVSLEPFAKRQTITGLPEIEEGSSTPIAATPTVQLGDPVSTEPEAISPATSTPRSTSMLWLSAGGVLLLIGLILWAVLDRTPGTGSEGRQTGQGELMPFLADPNEWHHPVLLKRCLPPLTWAAVSQDGRLLAISEGTDFGNQETANVSVWKLPSGTKQANLGPHPNNVMTVSFVPTKDAQEHILVAGVGRLNEPVQGKMVLWHVEKQSILGSILAHPHGIRWLEVSPDGSHLVSCGKSPESAIHVWDLQKILKSSRIKDPPSWTPKSSICLKTFEPHSTHVSHMAFSSNSSRLLTVADREIKCWTVPDWKLQAIYPMPPESGPAVVGDWSPNDQSIAVGTSIFGERAGRTEVVLWKNGEKAPRRIPSNWNLWSVLFTPDSRYLLTGDAGGYVSVIDTNDPREIRRKRVYGDSDWVSLGITPNGSLLAVGAMSQGKVTLFRTSPKEE